MKRLAKTRWLVAGCVAVGLMTTAAADEGDGPHLDHVFVIVMENHAYGQVVNNPNAPFTNQYARSANTADRYFAVAHPSLTNYLEIVGGSNFGVLTDNSPDWHNASCQPNIVSGVTATDNPPSPNICPIVGVGTDAPTVAIDTTNEITPPSILAVTNIDGASLPSARTVGMTIGDQLVARGRTWKSYQESLPAISPDGVNHSDGFFTDASDIPAIIPGEKQTMIQLYAVKHNPFAYFRNVQDGHDPANSLRNVVGFEGQRGLYDDLASGRVPDYAFIVPNQCNDQHGRGNAGPACDFDPSTTGTQEGLNPALMYQGDITLRTLVNAIHQSPAWHRGRNAIVVVWDENDYSATPNLNQVLVIVDTNDGNHGVHSDRRYTHFSLLKTIERGLGLPCLNHACDPDVPTMDDLFGRDR